MKIKTIKIKMKSKKMMKIKIITCEIFRLMIIINFFEFILL